MANDAKIQRLKSDIEMIKNTSTTQMTVANVTTSSKGIAGTGTTPSAQTMNGTKPSGDLLDLLGGMSATPSSGQSNTAQTQKHVTFGTGGNTGGAMAGWTTF